MGSSVWTFYVLLVPCWFSPGTSTFKDMHVSSINNTIQFQKTNLKKPYKVSGISNCIHTYTQTLLVLLALMERLWKQMLTLTFEKTNKSNYRSCVWFKDNYLTITLYILSIWRFSINNWIESIVERTNGDTQKKPSLQSFCWFPLVSAKLISWSEQETKIESTEYTGAHANS